MFRLFAYEILDEHHHAMLSWISSMEEFGFFMSVIFWTSHLLVLVDLDNFHGLNLQRQSSYLCPLIFCFLVSFLLGIF